MKKSNRTRTIGIAAMAALGVLACGDGVSMVGDAMVDAGEALLDAGHSLVDAGDAMRPDASAQPRTFEADCEPHVVERITERDTGSVISETTQYYAEVNVPGLSPDTATQILAIGCEREVFGINPETCLGSWICDRTPVEPMNCQTIVTQVENGRVRALCGGRSEQEIDGSTRVIGSRWTSVRFVVE